MPCRPPLVVAALLLAAGCSGATASPPAAAPPTRPAPSSAAASPSPRPSPPAPSPSARPTPGSAGTAAASPPFAASVSTVTAAQLPYSWHSGCPVGPDRLRLVRVTFHGFDGRAHTGALVVNAAVAGAVVRVFQRLYDAGFPIRRMEPVDAFHGSDDASMAADNTSAFNCRAAVAPGPPHWSAHAYGEAVDVNTVENPYVEGGRVRPPAGAAYTDRSAHRPGMAYPGGVLVGAFAAEGWQWGGRWTGSPDYQHFSSTGG